MKTFEAPEFSMNLFAVEDILTASPADPTEAPATTADPCPVALPCLED